MSTLSAPRLPEQAFARGSGEVPQIQHSPMAPASPHYYTLADLPPGHQPSSPLSSLLAGSPYTAPSASNVSSALRWPSAQQFYPLAHKVPHTLAPAHSLPSYPDNHPHAHAHPFHSPPTTTRPMSAPRPSSPAERAYTPDNIAYPDTTPLAHRASMPILSPHVLPYSTEELWVQQSGSDHKEDPAIMNTCDTMSTAMSTMCTMTSNVSTTASTILAVDAMKAARGYAQLDPTPSLDSPHSPVLISQASHFSYKPSSPTASEASSKCFLKPPSKPFNPVTHNKTPLPPMIRCSVPSTLSESSTTSSVPSHPSRGSTAAIINRHPSPSLAPLARSHSVNLPAPSLAPLARSHSATTPTSALSPSSSPFNSPPSRVSKSPLASRGRSPARKSPWCPAGANRSQSRGASPAQARHTRGSTVSPIRQPRAASKEPKGGRTKEQQQIQNLVNAASATPPVDAHTIVTHSHMYADSDSICSDSNNKLRMAALATAVSAVTEGEETDGQQLLQIAPSSGSSCVQSGPSIPSGGSVQYTVSKRTSRGSRGSSLRSIKLTDSEASSIDWSDKNTTTQHPPTETRKQWLDRMAAPKAVTQSFSGATGGGAAPSSRPSSAGRPSTASVIGLQRPRVSVTGGTTSGPGSVSGSSLPSSYASHASTLQRIAPSAAVTASVEASRNARMAAANAMRRNKYTLRRAASPSPVRDTIRDSCELAHARHRSPSPSPLSAPRTSVTSIPTTATNITTSSNHSNHHIYSRDVYDSSNNIDSSDAGKFTTSYSSSRSPTPARLSSSSLNKGRKPEERWERGNSPSRGPRFLHRMDQNQNGSKAGHPEPHTYRSSVDGSEYLVSDATPPTPLNHGSSSFTSASSRVPQSRSRATLDLPGRKVLLPPQVSSKGGAEVTPIEALTFERSASSNYSDTIPTAHNTIHWTNSCSSGATSSATDSPAAIMHHMVMSPTSAGVARRPIPRAPSDGALAAAAEHRRASSHGCVPQPSLSTKSWRKSSDTVLGRLMSSAARTPEAKEQAEANSVDQKRSATPGRPMVMRSQDGGPVASKRGASMKERPASAGHSRPAIQKSWMRLFSCTRFDV